MRVSRLTATRMINVSHLKTVEHNAIHPSRKIGARGGLAARRMSRLFHTRGFKILKTSELVARQQI
jgi:hypothetical protein